jgi:hypothetical protein
VLTTRVGAPLDCPICSGGGGGGRLDENVWDWSDAGRERGGLRRFYCWLYWELGKG